MSIKKAVKEIVDQAKDYAEGVNDKADGLADGTLEDAKKGRFTWAWGLAAAVVVVGLLALAL